MKISGNYDGGNIEVHGFEDDGTALLNIPLDTNSEFFQYFSFKASGLNEGETYKFKILNAGKSSYPDGWKIHPVPQSYDLQYWSRVPSSFKDGVLSFEIIAQGPVCHFSYFPPYPLWQHEALIGMASTSPVCKMHETGFSNEGRNVDLLKFGLSENPKRKVWIIARQHPGETMAEWFMEGLISKLMDTSDALSRSILEESDVYLVPNVNPDGSFHGNLRTNGVGTNLNREWDKASKEKSPEVLFILEQMEKEGIDICLDIHGDEDIPYVFISGAEGNPGFTDKLANQDKRFRKVWEESYPDFQTKEGYEIDAPGTADLSICTNQIAERFNILALTIEMPFTDNKNLPDPLHGWSPERSISLGESIRIPIWDFLTSL